MSDEVQQIDINWREVTKMILLAKGITSGLWLPGVKLRLAGAMLGPSQEELLPSGVVSVSGLRLRQVTQRGPLVFDAAELIKEDGPVIEQGPPAKKKATPRKRAVVADVVGRAQAPSVRKRKPTTHR